jgi:hypothetical protein
LTGLLPTAGLTVLMVILSTLIHHEVLQRCNDRLERLDWIAARAKVLLAMQVAFVSHLTQIALFAGAYWILGALGLGHVRGPTYISPLTLLYFSAETYTSLGFGDIYPVGDMRLVAGIEALTGLLMISWSASFTYLEMCRHWLARER